MARRLSIDERKKTFKEVNLPISYDEAIHEATRCLLCDDPLCEKGCPTVVEIPKFIRKIRFHDFKGAYLTIRKRNPLPGITARVCDTTHQCKRECTRAKIDSPIRIGDLQRFAADYGLEHKIYEQPPKIKRKEKIAIIGSGPAGLACGYELAKLGYNVTIFEKNEKPGGVLRYGIPEFRLPPHVVDYEISYIEKVGVNIVCNHRVSKIDDLFDKGFDAVFIGTGLSKSKKLDIEGSDKKGFYDGTAFLKMVREKNIPDLGDKVVIIGGGNTAIDCARTARRLVRSGEVTILYRRGDTEMPAFQDEVLEAKEEGVSFRMFHIPVKILGEDRVTGLLIQPTVLGEMDISGRRKPVPVANTYYKIDATAVISAIGEEIDTDFFDENGIEIVHGKVKVNENMETSKNNVFAGGDITSWGTLTVVDAAFMGRRAAFGIHKKFTAQEISVYERYIPEVPENIDISTTFCNVKFENPFILAAAPPSDDLDMVRDAFRAGWAGAVLKTTSVESNPVPLKYPMMEAVNLGDQRIHALTNIDLISEHHIDVIEKRVRALKKEFPEKVVIASIMGEKKEDWQTLVKRLEDAGVDMIECSFSCPQGTLGSKPGFMLGQDPKLVEMVTSWVVEAAKRVPVVIKITPQVTDIVEIAKAVKNGGASGICASNTIPSLIGIDVETFEPLPNVSGKTSYGGLSGPAIKPISLRNIAEILKNVDIEITGTGGPVTYLDAIEFMLLGVRNVQFCTAVMQYGFDIINDLKGGLVNYMEKMGFSSIEDFRGKALENITTHDQLVYEKKVVSHIDPNLCIGCNRCYVACHDGGHRAIKKQKNSIPVVDEEKCVGCNFCKLVCPVTGAIKIY